MFEHAGHVVADDPTMVWKPFEQRLAVTESLRQRRILQTAIDHAKAEALPDLDAVMATLVDNPQYFLWGPQGDVGPKGRKAVRDFYVAMFAGGGIGNLILTNERLVVDDDTIVTADVITRVLPGRQAREAGYAVPEEGGHYATRVRAVIMMPFDDDAHMCGEITYAAVNPLDFDHVEDPTPGYREYLRQLGREA